MPAAAHRDVLEFLNASALEDPPGHEEVVAGAQLAEIVALGASLDDLDPRAAAGVGFLFERIRSVFTTPACACTSVGEFHELQSKVLWSLLRIVDATTVLIYEAARARGGEVIFDRLKHGDRVAIHDVTTRMAALADGEAAQVLEHSQRLMDAATSRIRELAEHAHEGLQLTELKGFQRGVLFWILGVHLCAELVNRRDDLVPEPIWPGLDMEAAELASSGARLAGLFASFLGGLSALPEELGQHLTTLGRQRSFVAFVLEATARIPEVFGPEARFGVTSFHYPDEPDGAIELHMIIDTPLPVADACDRLDELCDGWWDDAAATLEFKFFPVLGVLDDE